MRLSSKSNILKRLILVWKNMCILYIHICMFTILNLILHAFCISLSLLVLIHSTLTKQRYSKPTIMYMKCKCSAKVHPIPIKSIPVLDLTHTFYVYSICTLLFIHLWISIDMNTILTLTYWLLIVRGVMDLLNFACMQKRTLQIPIHILCSC